jgi:hypothetical protein
MLKLDHTYSSSSATGNGGNNAISMPLVAEMDNHLKRYIEKQIQEGVETAIKQIQEMIQASSMDTNATIVSAIKQFEGNHFLDNCFSL